MKYEIIYKQLSTPDIKTMTVESPSIVDALGQTLALPSIEEIISIKKDEPRAKGR